MRQSVRIVEQAIEQMPDGPIMPEKAPRRLRLPPGEVYMRTENPRGEYGIYLVSKGGEKPYRLKIRSVLPQQPDGTEADGRGPLRRRRGRHSGLRGHRPGRGGQVSALETFFDNVWVDALWRLLAVLGLMVLVVLALTYVERKFIGRIQMRLGPMRTGPYGIMQPIADMVKILLKEDLRPASADRIAFELAPFLAFVPVFLTLLALPFTAKWDVRVLDLGLLYFIAVSGLTVLGYIFAGWASDNKYALIGALRTAAQLISYEVPLVLAVLALSMLAGSLNLVDIVEKQGRVPFIVWQPLGFFLFMAAAVSDLTRRPFDVAAAESEVAGGPWIEFSGIRWSILYALTEYTNMFALCVLGSLIFLGGWDWPLGLKWGWWWQLALIFAKTSAPDPGRHVDERDVPARPRRPAHVVLLEAAAAAGVRRRSSSTASSWSTTGPTGRSW